MATALVIIDVQEAMFLQPTPPHHGPAVVSRIANLLARARADKVPVYFVRHDGGPNDDFERGTPSWQIHAPIAPLAGEPIVEKRYPSAFHETGFDELLKRDGIDRLVICGMQTEYCVDSTCRAAFGLGYKIVLVSDAHTTFDSPVLSSGQIRSHHNQTLGGSFVECVPTLEVAF
ncbi:MAG TPA: cysteine hydrolase family protein [Aliidongia sp.]|uniref:cysteine hydrolase family protein n=1 Tax=Aliidongia sp. TaxID=1914230 RepID=UPI002DDCE152|nr:cysteine hydrolase family protein [Aliidongia sp.]HEV2676230.1 cysteine hydrolase family protein [Aliidongia sp.]